MQFFEQDVLQDNMKYAFDIDLPEDIRRQVQQVQEARVVSELKPTLVQTDAKEFNESSKRQIVVGFMDIDPLSAAEKVAKPTRGIRSHWLS